MKNSHDAFKATIQKKHEEIKVSLGNLINTVGAIATDKDKKEERVSKIISRIISLCSLLQDILMPEARPKWVDELKSACQRYLSKQFDATSFTEIYSHHYNITHHNWNFNIDANGMSFHAIYQEYKKDSKLPELLDELITLIEKLLNECGDDIQTKTFKDVSTLLSTVKINKNSSYDAIQTTLYLVWDFFKKVFFTLYPAIKISSDAIHTVLKIGEVLDKANSENEKIRTRIIEKTSASLNNNLTYNSQGLIEGGSILPENVQKSIDHKT